MEFIACFTAAFYLASLLITSSCIKILQNFKTTHRKLHIGSATAKVGYDVN